MLTIFKKPVAKRGYTLLEHPGNRKDQCLLPHECDIRNAMEMPTSYAPPEHSRVGVVPHHPTSLRRILHPPARKTVSESAAEAQPAEPTPMATFIRTNAVLFIPVSSWCWFDGVVGGGTRSLRAFPRL